MTDRDPARYAIVGGGRRSTFFLRLMRDMPERYQVTAVHARSAETRAAVSSAWGVRTVATVDELLGEHPPEFVIVAVPWPAAPELTSRIAGLGVPVLEETPPAPDLQAMRYLWAEVGASNLVQVADQSKYMPSHAARAEIIKRGLIGRPTSVHVSSNHLYHAVSIMRFLLGVGCDETRVSAHDFVSPIVDPHDFDGWTGDSSTVDKPTTIATLDFGAARMGLYDFTENQWFNPLRQRRLLVRGTHGEMVDDRVIRLQDPRTPVLSQIVRRQTGIDLNLEGFDLDNISFDGAAVYRNEYQGARLSDEDIAAAALVEQMAGWVRGEATAPYPLAEGLQDHLLGLAIEESARTGATVTVLREPWAESGSGHGLPPIITNGRAP